MLWPDRLFMQQYPGGYHSLAPHLHYADYLDGLNHPVLQAQAELIRVQCQLHLLDADDSEYEHLVQRQNELILQNYDTWTDHLKPFVEGASFRFGILDSVTMEAKRFLEIGEQVFERAPIRRVRLLGLAPWIDQLAESPLLRFVKELDLCGNNLGQTDYRKFLHSRYLDHVVSLDLSFNGIDQTFLRELARSQSFSRLRRLFLNDNAHISGEGLELLSHADIAETLLELDLSGNSLQLFRNHLDVLSRDRFKVLSRLKIEANPLADYGITLLLRSSLSPCLLSSRESLQLRSVRLTGKGMKVLSRSPIAKRVSRLDLSGNMLGDAGIRSIVSAAPNSLTKLLLARNMITDLGALVLAESKLMQQLELVDLSSNRLTNLGADRLWARRKNWLTRLDLTDNPIPSHYRVY